MQKNDCKNLSEKILWIHWLAILAYYRLDESPQIFEYFKRHMSLVGPRSNDLE